MQGTKEKYQRNVYPSQELRDWFELAATYALSTRSPSEETRQAIQYMKQWLCEPARAYDV